MGQLCKCSPWRRQEPAACLPALSMTRDLSHMGGDLIEHPSLRIQALSTLTTGALGPRSEQAQSCADGRALQGLGH